MNKGFLKFHMEYFCALLDEKSEFADSKEEIIPLVCLVQSAEGIQNFSALSRQKAFVNC